MKLLIMSSSTGGGHDMRANALAELWSQEGGAVRICRPMEDGTIVYGLGIWFYNFIQLRMPWFHQVYFRVLENMNLHKGKGRLLGTANFRRQLHEFQPDILFSVHAHLNHGYYDLAKHITNSPFKFMIFCGELADGPGFSRHWINPEADFLGCPTSESAEAAIKRGMPRSKTFDCGFLLRKQFYCNNGSKDSQEFLESIGLKRDESFLLLGTGANGANQHLSVCRSLRISGKSITVVALCGNNSKLRRQLAAFGKSEGMKILALPKIDATGMFFLLSKTKCLFARPGAGTTSEALACGTPIIFNSCGGIMPQEQNNLNFLKKRGHKILCTSKISEIPKLLEGGIPSLKISVSNGPNLLLESMKDGVCFRNS